VPENPEAYREVLTGSGIHAALVLAGLLVLIGGGVIGVWQRESFPVPFMFLLTAAALAWPVIWPWLIWRTCEGRRRGLLITVGLLIMVPAFLVSLAIFAAATTSFY
jgi:hypothetical protein